MNGGGPGDFSAPIPGTAVAMLWSYYGRSGAPTSDLHAWNSLGLAQVCGGQSNGDRLEDHVSRLQGMATYSSLCVLRSTKISFVTSTHVTAGVTPAQVTAKVLRLLIPLAIFCQNSQMIVCYRMVDNKLMNFAQCRVCPDGATNS